MLVSANGCFAPTPTKIDDDEDDDDGDSEDERADAMDADGSRANARNGNHLSKPQNDALNHRTRFKWWFEGVERILLGTSGLD